MELENALINGSLDIRIRYPDERCDKEIWTFEKNNDNEYTSLYRPKTCCDCNCHCHQNKLLVYSRTKEYETMYDYIDTNSRKIVDYSGHFFSRNPDPSDPDLIELVRVYTFGERVTGEIMHNMHGSTDAWERIAYING